MDADQAEIIALQALAFLAEDAQRLGSFLALTGLGPDELRAQARDAAPARGRARPPAAATRASFSCSPPIAGSRRS